MGLCGQVLTPIETYPWALPTPAAQRARVAKRADTARDPAALDRAVAARTRRWEIGASKLLAGASVAVIAIALASWGSIGPELAVCAALLAAMAGLYFTVYWQLLARGVGIHPWVRWFNATVEGSLPTLALVIIAAIKGAEWAVSSQVFLLYLVMIAASSARLRPTGCAYVGAVGILGYLAVFYGFMLPELTAGDKTAPAIADSAGWQRALWLSACAAMVTYTTARVRGLALTSNTETFNRRLLERALRRYVSSGVADKIMSGETPDDAARRDVTVLFCDLRDFTALCEREPPEKVVTFLNTFYEKACTIIQSHGGTVNKFMGDGLLALFGAPEDHPAHATAAAAAAHELMYAADELRARGGLWRHLDIGIGLDSGDVVVGAIGARDRAEYTAIGTTVNRAARLQGLSRQAHRRIVLSRDYVRRLGPRAAVVSVGSVKLKGLSEPVDVYAFRHS